MAENYKIIEYTDERLANNTVNRVYSDGRTEWRNHNKGEEFVRWREFSGATGKDELLGDRIVKRTFDADNKVVYGREQGYGRTLWSNGVLTVNRTKFEGKIGAALVAVGGAALMGGLIAPPLAMSAQEEEALRQQRKQQQSDGGSSGGGDSSSSSDSDSEASGSWDEGGDLGDADSDFG